MIWISDTLASKIRFQWEYTYDVDTDSELNYDITFNKYYSVELVEKESGNIIPLINDFSIDDCMQSCNRAALLEAPYCGMSNDTICVDIDILENIPLDYNLIDIEGNKAISFLNLQTIIGNLKTHT